MELPTIDGKKIVPVRLIPFIANGWLGHETLPGILANKVKVSGFPYPSDCDQVISLRLRDNGVYAYHLNDDRMPVKMWSSEWDIIHRAISVLEPLLRETEDVNGVPDSMESTWLLEATKVLPPGVFLWRDNLDAIWDEHVRAFITTPSEPRHFRDMNYDAYLRPEYSKLVWEGFEHLKKPAPSALLPPAVNTNTPNEQPAQETVEDACNRLAKGGIGKEEIAYTLFNMGFQNNMIGGALGLTYKKGKNDVSSQVVRWRKKHEKTLGG